MKSTKTAIAAAVLCGCIGSSAFAADVDPQMSAHGGPTVALFAGADVRQRSWYTYGGFVFAPFGDLTQDGFLVRGIIGGGEYEYDIATGEIDGEHINLEGMLGYQMFLDLVRLGVYAGVNVQDHDHSPNDPGNSTAGTEVGFTASGEIETLDAAPFYANVSGTVSTANDTYWTRGRIGMRFDQFVIGPEGSLAGNDEYDSARIGGFIMTTLGTINISVSAGYADVDGTQGDDSAYGTIGIGTAF